MLLVLKKIARKAINFPRWTVRKIINLLRWIVIKTIHLPQVFRAANYWWSLTNCGGIPIPQESMPPVQVSLFGEA
jgi:hypothetical protein